MHPMHPTPPPTRLLHFARHSTAQALWRGNGANVVRLAPDVAFKFVVHDQFKIMFAPVDGSALGVGEKLAAAAATGAPPPLDRLGSWVRHVCRLLRGCCAAWQRHAGPATCNVPGRAFRTRARPRLTHAPAGSGPMEGAGRGCAAVLLCESAGVPNAQLRDGMC